VRDDRPYDGRRYPLVPGGPGVCQRGPVVGRRVLPRPCGVGRRRADDLRAGHQRNPVLGFAASRLPGGQVTVSVGIASGSLRVDVIDQGKITPCMAAPRGLGQGLALVAALADASGADGRDRWFALRTGGAL